MSTRYVWGVYNTTASRRSSNLLSVQTTTFYNSLWANLANAYQESIGVNREGEPVTVYVSSGANKEICNPNTVSSNIIATRISDYTYATVRCYATSTTSGQLTSESYLLESYSGSGAYWHAVGTRSAVTIWTSDNSSYEDPNNANKLPFYITGGKLAQGGTLIRTESAASRSKTEGAFTESGEFRWRTYRGSDNIDPSAVTYSNSDLYPGEPVTIQLTARTPVYGGTVYYQYQYSVNGGSSWTNIGSKTTSTSATVTIPENAQQFRARVLASDNYGFTSTTYVYGPDTAVSQMKGYAAVNGVSLALKKGCCTVNGVIRDIAKGYVTIGGKWKKLF